LKAERAFKTTTRKYGERTSGKIQKITDLYSKTPLNRGEFQEEIGGLDSKEKKLK